MPRRLFERNLDARQNRGGWRNNRDRHGDALGVRKGDRVAGRVGRADGSRDVRHAVGYSGHQTCGGVKGYDGASGVVRGERRRGNVACEGLSELVEAQNGCGRCCACEDESDGACGCHVVSFVELDFDAVEVGFRAKEFEYRLLNPLIAGETFRLAEVVEFIELAGGEVQGKTKRVHWASPKRFYMLSMRSAARKKYRQRISLWMALRKFIWTVYTQKRPQREPEARLMFTSLLLWVSLRHRLDTEYFA